MTGEDYALANAIRAALEQIPGNSMEADDAAIIFRHVFTWHKAAMDGLRVINNAILANQEAHYKAAEERTWKCPECDTKMVVCDEAGVIALDRLAEEQTDGR